MQDDAGFNGDQLTRLAGELAALVRQYGRAADAGDTAAQELEGQAICDRVRWLMYHHLDLRVGMASDRWVWLNRDDVDCFVERGEGNDLRARGRIRCSLPEGQQEWTEPFAADIRHSPTTRGLSSYTVWFGSRATMLDLAAVRDLIASGEVLTPRAPDREDGWAFVFRMGEHI
jgi:hypothetical protein